jgi:hypothetical protein
MPRPNEPKKRYPYDNLGGGELGGEKAPAGRKELNDALRKANPRGTVETKKAGMASLSEKSVGDEYRERQKQARLAALEEHRRRQ